MTQRTIAIIEDEPTIATAVSARLTKEGFRTEVASDGPTGVALCDRLRPDLVVLDLMLPGLDGLEVCRRVQKLRPTPVLMLTARDSETDVLVGLGVGADDYLTKPFSMRELVARVHALLRRVERYPSQVREVVELGDLYVDPARRRVLLAGEEIKLTPIEFDLVHHLASRPGEVFTRDRLLQEVWGYRDSLGTRTVDSHIGSLRRKLGPDLIRTVHGFGYSLEG